MSSASALTPWESQNGYVPPPRFQQLRAQQQLEEAQETQPVEFSTSNPGGDSSPSHSPQMSHTRSSSFFSFRKSNKPADGQRSAHQRAMSSAGNVAKGQPPPHNIPPSQFGVQQAQPNTPPNQAALPPPPQQPQQRQASPQRPQAQPSQSSPNMGHQSTASITSLGGGPSPLHPEIRSVVQLTVAHAHKVYFSGPLVRRLERLPDGQKPHKDDGWMDIWAQLGGTTLSIWDMKEIQEASKQGKEVPPSYINVTDAFFQVLGSVTVPATATTPSKRYTNVLTLNNAGSNLYLFSCPSTAALISWAAALRLAAWEKSRLEEIYTAHLIRITLSARDVPTTLVRGRMEGWARVRIAGQTDWKRVWLSVQEGSDGADHIPASNGGNAAGPNVMKKKRMSNLFARESTGPQSPLPPKPMIFMFSSPKPKDRKKPLMTISSVVQAFGVYPERPELISKSTLMKIEGTFGDEEMAGSLRTREGWTLIMPELENNVGQAAEMLKWIVALHDAFELYGRPEAWTWDPRDDNSLMFGYPVGPQKETLFLEREVVESLDPREERTSFIRVEMKKLLHQHMRHPVQVVQNRLTPQDSGTPPLLPPINGINSNGNLPSLPSSPPKGQTSPGSGPQLPPLAFGSGPSSNTTPQRERPLTPITERSSILTHGRSISIDAPLALNSSQSVHSPQAVSPSASQAPQRQGEAGPSVFGGPISHSPPPGTGSPAPTQPILPPQPGPSNIPPPTLTTMPSSTSNVLSSQTSASSLHKTTPSIAGSPPMLSPQSEEKKSFEHVSPPPGFASSPHKNTSSMAGSPPTLSPRSEDKKPFDHIHPPPGNLHTYPPSGSPSVLSPQSEAKKSFDHVSPPPGFSPSPQGSPPNTVTHDYQKPASPTPNFLSAEARSKTQDTQASALSGTSIDPVSETSSFAGKPWNQSTVANQQGPSSLSTTQSTPAEEPSDFMHEAGELYFMQQGNDPKQAAQKSQPQPPISQDSYDEEDDGYAPSTASPTTTNPYAGIASSVDSHYLPIRRGTPMAFTEPANTNQSPSKPVGRLSPTRSVLGRKPSGARAPNTPRVYKPENISSQTLTETTEGMDAHSPPNAPPATDFGYDDVNGEALAAMHYLNMADSEVTPSSMSPSVLPPGGLKGESSNIHALDNGHGPAGQSTGGGDGIPYKSSFAPSNKAAERKAKAQAQKDAHLAAVHKPGRANGKRKSRVGGAWESSEEEEEEEEEDDDVDSDGEVPNRRGPQSTSSHHTSSHQNMSGSGYAGRSVPMPAGPSDLQQDMNPPQSHLRASRILPEIPGGRGPGPNEQPQPIPRRTGTGHHTDAGRSMYYEDGPQIRTQAEAPMPGAARQSVWSQVLDPGRPAGRPPTQPDHHNKDTFVQLEPSETMTKAFTPQGLLSAGLQDKEDRSAKRQEVLARESGASLINVPNKPPPPQTGLLGAVSAHERERKREGGLGAALTEREREKRVVEERQRRFDEQQRQQMDQMQQGGSMYGGQFGYNPMMNPMMIGMMGMNPMMTGGGMNPMMTGGGGMPPMMTGGMPPMNPMMSGFPGMMGGYNPQHMFAAQQAAQAYQQAMMAFSTAGSQAGGEGGNGGAQDPQVGMNPGMAGGSQMGAMSPAMNGGMAGYDPRMSMFGMPMMGMGMGMGMPQMGSQMGSQMAPLGVQTTGMSNFDPRASPGANGSPGIHDQGLQPPSSQMSSRGNSPRRGSPLASGNGETFDRGRPITPK